MTEIWERDAETPDEYHCVEAIRGREFIIRLTTGADVFLAIQKFAIDNNIDVCKNSCRLYGWAATGQIPGVGSGQYRS